MQTPDAQSQYPAELFRRQDESDDRLFYAEPRLVTHIDDYAIEAIRAYLREALPPHGTTLDLMSSWRSHLPYDLPLKRVIGLGLNAVELDENPQLTDRVAHDLNAEPRLPLETNSVDAAIVTVSIQYIVKPIAVFREINRILRAGAAFHVIYSNRMFPTKAVAIWQSIDDRMRAQLIGSYFANSGGWTTPKAMDISPNMGFYTDPVYVVTANKVKVDG